MSNQNNDDIFELIKQVLGQEKCVTFEGTSQKGEGYMGDVFFLKVSKENGGEKEEHLVAKVSKIIPNMQDTVSIVFKTEIFFYKEVFPIFIGFQASKGVENPLNAIARCQQTFIGEGIEMIILENMKSRGFEMHPSNVPQNLNHIKLVLKNYAKFHAISLALKEQKKEVFKLFFDFCQKQNFLEELEKFRELMEKSAVKVIKYLTEGDREDLAAKFKILQGESITDALRKTMEDIPEEQVLIHGDCHNNNYLFKYEDESKENPVDVVFLDFQMLDVQSPMQDLGCYLYMVSSKNELNHFTELMEFYHRELSTFLAKLGCDVDTVFPISTMWKHWEKYRFNGFVKACLFLDLFFTEEAPDTSHCKDNVEMFCVKMNEANKKAYLERLVFMVEHYFSFKSK